MLSLGSKFLGVNTSLLQLSLEVVYLILVIIYIICIHRHYDTNNKKIYVLALSSKPLQDFRDRRYYELLTLMRLEPRDGLSVLARSTGAFSISGWMGGCCWAHLVL